ncbi:MAG: urease accessory protein UreD [Paracoccaceae bacterium]
MLDSGLTSQLQRSRGSASVGFVCRDGVAGLATLQQSGSAKAMLPRVHSAVPEVVFLNTSGGLTGGDSLSYALDIPAGTEVTATTQTAERGYASTGLQANVRVAARVGTGGRLNWLPQETLLYEDSSVSRETKVELNGDAACLMVESVILGRHAMGEAPRNAKLTDRRIVTRNGRLIWAETLHLNRNALSQTGQPAILNGANCFAIIALIAPKAPDFTDLIRATLTEPGCQSAASGWDGKLLVRITATDGWPLRQQVARTLRALTNLPRVWQMPGTLP